jgi:CelD/BcsL family acetyltransferase involved in cellulose biosynthesis
MQQLSQLSVQPVMSQADREAFERVVNESPAGLMYASLRYRAFLELVLENAEAHYYVAYEDGVAAGVLPVFRVRDSSGDVVNSLPFFGSHGGPLLSPVAKDPDAVRAALLNRWTAHATDQGVRAATLITNPLDAAGAASASQLPRDFEDTRIGQFTLLPARESGLGREVLMSLFHQKTRNAVRKAEKSGIHVTHSSSIEALRTLAALHTENMQSIGGTSKPWSVFDALARAFRYDQDYRVYVATVGDSIVAALLVLYHGRAAEYFTPATQADARELQPMSLLIFEAMMEAAERGFRYWNWGGTWQSQTGVYRFKSRWGTTDLNYSYFTTVNDRTLLKESPESLRERYPYFYAVPFSSLQT